MSTQFQDPLSQTNREAIIEAYRRGNLYGKDAPRTWIGFWRFLYDACDQVGYAYLVHRGAESFFTLSEVQTIYYQRLDCLMTIWVSDEREFSVRDLERNFKGEKELEPYNRIEFLFDGDEAGDHRHGVHHLLTQAAKDYIEHGNQF